MQTSTNSNRMPAGTGYLISLLLAIFPLICQGQHTLPQLWYRADQTGLDSTAWQCFGKDSVVAGTGSTSFLPDMGWINFNPAFSIPDSFPGFSNTLVAAPKAATIYMVYQPAGSSQENFLWNLHLSAEKSLQLSSRRLTQFRSEIEYADTGMSGALISASYLSWKPVDEDSTGVHLRFVGTDTMGMEGLVAEFLYFPEKLKTVDDQIYQSYLAIKYGVTLHESSYLTGSGDTVWSYDEAGIFTHDVIAIGKDSSMLLDQKQSHSFDDILTLSAGVLMPSNALNATILAQGDYVFISNDGKALSPRQAPYLADTNVNAILKRSWMVRPAGYTSRNIPTSLVVDVSGLSIEEAEHCFLLLDTTGLGAFALPGMVYVYPDSVVNDSLAFFSGILWDADLSGTDVFTLAVKEKDNSKLQLIPEPEAGLVQQSQSQQTENLTLSSKENVYNLYPNPTSGTYNLKVSLAAKSDIQIEVYDNGGRLYDRYSDSGSSEYLFERAMKVPGLYQIRITTPDQSESLHLIVR
jgi:hypothetical protein